ncbi:PfkB family carbohydrate kinase [Tessaracoccus defluvii]|uniref:PfkB family carbohydrate kinase n=1 Tax=Tessaracoccus defluvii TaxID=1285901 RepID=UPI0021F7B411|nr:PfkB family carbohydrate kinase [Tessaracoccus defluvii]
MSRVVVVGSLNVDLHLLLQRHITPGETLLASGGTFSPGGKGANQACAAALAGAETTMCGAIGDDASSSVATSLLEAAGVDVSHVRRVPGPTGLAVVSVDAEGENSVVVVPGANAEVSPAMVDDWADVIAGADVVVLQGEISAASNLEASRLVRGRLVVNLAPVIDVAPSCCWRRIRSSSTSMRGPPRWPSWGAGNSPTPRPSCAASGNPASRPW